MDSYLSEQQIEELVNFDYIGECILSELIEENESKINIQLDEFSNINYTV
jgi:hypothetical protein|tara:strand:- start:599 stop:748 length:150 start_codon:yes stop_codon:yes gene_type:complete